jgi:hypothetical protein
MPTEQKRNHMTRTSVPQNRIAFALAALIALVACLPSAVYAGPSKPVFFQETPAAKVARLLERSGYKYEKPKADANVWKIKFTGKSLPSFDVILASQDDLLVTFVIVAQKKNLQLTPALMQKLLGYNHNIDQVKVGIDDDGDLFVRSDQHIRVLDDREFKDIVEQVAAAADEVYSGVK